MPNDKVTEFVDFRSLVKFVDRDIHYHGYAEIYKDIFGIFFIKLEEIESSNLGIYGGYDQISRNYDHSSNTRFSSVLNLQKYWLLLGTNREIKTKLLFKQKRIFNSFLENDNLKTFLKPDRFKEIFRKRFLVSLDLNLIYCDQKLYLFLSNLSKIHIKYSSYFIETIK